VNFAPGTTSATLSGDVPAGGVKEYVLWAAADQSMHVQTVGYSAPVNFTLTSPRGETWSGEFQPSDVYIFATQVTLPQSGDYLGRLSVPPAAGATRYDVTFTISAFSQPPTPPPIGSPERVNFAPGATSATVAGNLQASGSDFYVLRALGGQTMTVELSFTEGRAILAIWGRDGTVLLSDHAEVSSFRGVLPSTQDYYILVKGRPEGETEYRMEIVIPPLSSD
jgi:hypothetical protein